MYETVDQNLRTALRFFGRASGKGTIVEGDGLLLIDSGVDYAVFNIAILTAPVESETQLELRIGTAAEWYAARRTRWSLWVCDDLIPSRLRRISTDVFAHHRLRSLTQAPGMLAERLDPASRYLPALEYRPVGDSETRLDFAHITTLCFDIPFVTSRAIYEPPAAWEGDYVGYVGYLNRRAICTVALVVAADAVGVYSVSTIPEYRGKGYAEALIRQVLKDAYAVSGIERTVLQATRAGHQMYHRMGYRNVTQFSVFIV